MDRIRRRKQIKNTTSKEQEKEEKKFKKNYISRRSIKLEELVDHELEEFP